MTKDYNSCDTLSGQSLQQYDLISARVHTVNTNSVTLRLPNNHECSIPIEEFFNDEGILNVHSEDLVTIAKNRFVFPEQTNSFSYRIAQQIIGLLQIQNAWESDTSVTGVIECPVDGGFRVLIKGNGAFLPIKNSVYDLTQTALSEIVGQAGKFKVSRFDPISKNISLSLVSLKPAASHRDISAITQTYEEGDIVEGTVRRIVRYGAFIEIKGVFCLLHMSDISWKRVEDIHDFVWEGQHIKVKILKIDSVSKRINVGIKQLQENNPWNFLESRYPKGMVLKRKIISITDYGVFVEIEPGIQGLIHVHELWWGRGYKDPHAYFQIGETIEAVVINIDVENQKIALSCKRCVPNPWERFARQHKVGELLRVKIRTINSKGIFVEVAPGIDGRISPSDFPEGKTKDDIESEEGIGSEVEARLLQIDPDTNKIRLTMLPDKKNSAQ